MTQWNTRHNHGRLLTGVAIALSGLFVVTAAFYLVAGWNRQSEQLATKTVSQQRILDRHLNLDLSMAKRIGEIQELSETNQDHIDAIKADLATASERLGVVEQVLAQVSSQIEQERTRVNDRIISIESECRRRGFGR